MKKLAIMLLLSFPVVVSASNCDEIKANIAEKIKNNGVPENNFQLKLVPANQVKQGQGKVVGSCNGGKKRIIYIRGKVGSSSNIKSVKDETKAPVEPSILPNSTTPKDDGIPNKDTAPVIDSSGNEKIQSVVEPTVTSSTETTTQAPTTESATSEEKVPEVNDTVVPEVNDTVVPEVNDTVVPEVAPKDDQPISEGETSNDKSSN